MDPNQQPNQIPEGPQPQIQPQPSAPQPAYPPMQQQPPVQQQPAQPQPMAPAPLAPTLPSSYNAAAPPAYDPNYLDSIAPPPARAKFFSGSFGKIFFVMIGVFILAVSLIVAFSGKDKTADLQQTTVRVANFVTLTKAEQTYLKSNKLSANNTGFTLQLTNAQTDGEKLLGQAGVKKTQYDKTMTASEKKLSADLKTKFEDARLNAQLDSTYARTMAGETEKLIALFTTMSKQSKAKAIRDYAKNMVTNLTPIQKTFDDYVDDGN